MRLLDTHVISDLLRNLQGRASSLLAAVGDGTIVTGVIVAGELRYACINKVSAWLSERLDAVSARCR